MTEASDPGRPPRADDRPYVVRTPSGAELALTSRRLYDVLLLAEHLPTRHSPTLEFPPMTRFVRRRA